MPTTTLQGFQLSPQQKRLWLLQQNDSVYLTQGAIAIEGDSQPARLKQVVERIVARHQILRTNFSRLPGVKLPIMTVGEGNWFGWKEINLEDRQLNLEELFEQARQEYNLETDAILQLSLFHVAVDSYILQITLPALCGDRWTLKNLFNEIVDGYVNYLESRSSDELQYVQFSEWQNQLLTDEDAETAQKFWQQQVESLSELKLPVENKFVKSSPWKIQTLEITVTPEVTAKLETIAQKYRTTPAVVLLACWQILIWRLTESSVVIGTECNRREYEEMHSIMGLLATWLPIKSDLTPDLSFAEVLRVIGQTLESVGEWQDYFVPDSFFPIGFEYQELPISRDTGEVFFSWLKQSSCIEKFKLKLCSIRRQNSLLLEINYDCNYFSPESIISIARQLQTLLENGIQNPETKIDRLTILPASDRQKIFQFNQTQQDYLEDKCVHQLFEAQVEKTPHNLAVVFEEKQLTYSQLNHKANQLAHYLRQCGVKPEVLVGLYLEKSHLSTIGLLGILKAGGAYLPLDSNLPTAALSDRLEASQIVLTQQKLVPTLPQSIKEIICLDDDWEKIEAESNVNLPNKTTKENLAYVLYTSGSTGKPKGVAIEHRQLLNYYYGISDRLNFKENQNFALVSSLAADLGNTVIFPALLTGGCLHLITPERATNPEAFADYSDRHSLDCLKIVPSHLNALLSAAEPEKILPQKCLILGGETLTWQLIHKIQQYQPSCQIFNHYGPTETTVGVCTFAIPQETIISPSETVPLGKAIANTQIHLLDHTLQPVPIGVPGEIYIGGAQVSRGYLNQPELTAEKFISNPFTLNSNNYPPVFQSLLYKTGDKARYLPDGNLEFLGRIDHQVKIRGYRIELGEIESTLQQHLSINDAIVTVRVDTGNKRLVAYIVPEQQQKLRDTDLQNFLKQKLPDYMIPAVWIQLKALPLAPNGKVDRQALPAPEQVKPQSEKAFVPPRNPTEAILVDIWAKVLEIERVSIDDNFFELGGDSILSIQIIAKVNQAGLQATPKQIFEYPTVASLAAEISTQDTSPEIDVTPEANNYEPFLPELKDKIAPDLFESIEDIYELTPIQKGILFHSLYDSENGLYLFQATFTLKTLLNIDAFAAAWQQVVQRHTILRTGFYWEDIEQPLQVVYQQATVLFKYHDWRGVEHQYEQMNCFLDSDRANKFDLAQPCPMRLNLFRLADDIYELVWTRHFIVADGWSAPLILNEVVQIYQAICERQELSLAPSTPFRSYIDWLQRQDTSQAEQFWRKMLKEIKNPTPLNNLYGCNERSRNVGKASSPEYEDRQIALSPAMSSALNTFVKQNHLTLNTLIQGTWAILHSYYSSQQDVVYGCTVSGRPPELKGVESIAGMLLNTLPVRVNADPNQTILPWLKQLQKILVEIRQYEYSPLVEVKAWSKIPPASPLFESIVVFENLPEPENIREDKRPLEITDFNTFYKINYPITVVVVPVFPLLVGINYDFNLVDVGTIDGILTHFKMALKFIIDNPKACLKDISLLTEKQQQIVTELERQVTFEFDSFT